jgi:two-component system, NarL family, response regulator NreC
MSISIVLADDHPVIRRGLRGLLEMEPDFAILAEAGDGLEAIRVVERIQPDVLILDLLLPGLSGLDVLPIVRQRAPKTNVVVFSMYSNEDFILQALKNGATGYIPKGCDPIHTIEGIRRAATGRRYLGPAISEHAFDAYHPAIRMTCSLPGNGRSCSSPPRVAVAPRSPAAYPSVPGRPRCIVRMPCEN